VSKASMASISKSKRRGWGDARVSFDEGKGGGTSGASIQLLLGAGGQPSATSGVAARLGVQRKGKTPIGPVWAERPELGRVENKWKMNGLLREFWAKLTMCCGKNLF
jgi:hypothetical protein